MNDSLLAFLENSPTPFQAVQNLSYELTSRGFSRLEEGDRWVLEPGGAYFVQRGGGGLAAFRVGKSSPADAGFQIALAHTDSPGLKLKLRAQEKNGGLIRAGVEVYGSPILTTWMDRDLSLAGQVVSFHQGRLNLHPVDFKDPLAVIPSLAIHYNREVNKGGWAPDPQHHLRALVSPPQGEGTLEEMIGNRLGLDPASMVDQDLYFYPSQPPVVIGEHLINAGRIDNLSGCHGVMSALTGAEVGQRTLAAFFFEAEEVGSLTLGGAHSRFIGDLMDRIILGTGGSSEDVYRTRAKSFAVSVDAAHGVHPNFSDKHDPSYAPVLGGGPVIKLAAGARYATSASTGAHFEGLCREAGVPCQKYIMRSDLTPGSTVGPVTSALNALETVDVGVPLWGMHSARETADLRDHGLMIQALTAFYNSKG